MCGSYGHPLDTFHNTDIAGKVLPYLKRAVSLSPRVAQELWSRILTTELAYQIAVNTEVNGKILRREEFGPYFDRLSAMDVEVFLGAVTGLGSHSVEMFLPDLKVPTLVVAGQHDTFTPAWLSERMHELLPNSELLMIPGGSHVAPIEQPELLHLRFRDFLSNAIAPKKKVQAKAKRKSSAKKSTTKKATEKKASPKKVTAKKAFKESRPKEGDQEGVEKESLEEDSGSGSGLNLFVGDGLKRRLVSITRILAFSNKFPITQHRLSPIGIDRRPVFLEPARVVG